MIRMHHYHQILLITIFSLTFTALLSRQLVHLHDILRPLYSLHKGTGIEISELGYKGTTGIQMAV